MILTTYPVTFTTPSPQKIHHGAGVAGYTHRYIASTVPNAPGSTAPALPDYVGDKPLVGANGPTVRAFPDGRKYLEFDGVNDAYKADGIPVGDVMTFVMVARVRSVDTATTILAAGEGVSINRAGDGGTAINPGSGAVSNTMKLDNTWRVVVATANGSTATLTIDGVKISVPGTGVFGLQLSLGANGTPSNFSPLDVVEVITFPTVLTDTQTATVREALKAAYPSLLS